MKSLYDTLQESLVTEMSLGLTDFKHLIDNLSNQIIENWCLVWYCDNYDKDNQNRWHWTGEFLALAKRIATKNIQIKNKKKAINDVFKNWNTYTNKLTIISCISDKMKKEHLEKYTDNIANAFIKNINEIINILSEDYTNIEEYMDYPIGY